MHTIRRCRDDEKPTILAIVNAAADELEGSLIGVMGIQPVRDADLETSVVLERECATISTPCSKALF